MASLTITTLANTRSLRAFSDGANGDVILSVYDAGRVRGSLRLLRAELPALLRAISRVDRQLRRADRTATAAGGGANSGG